MIDEKIPEVSSQVQGHLNSGAQVINGSSGSIEIAIEEESPRLLQNTTSSIFNNRPTGNK
jgi:hypothetical protein